MIWLGLEILHPLSSSTPLLVMICEIIWVSKLRNSWIVLEWRFTGKTSPPLGQILAAYSAEVAILTFSGCKDWTLPVACNVGMLLFCHVACCRMLNKFPSHDVTVSHKLTISLWIAKMILNPLFSLSYICWIEWDVFFWNVNGWYMEYSAIRSSSWWQGWSSSNLAMAAPGGTCPQTWVVFWVYLKIWGMGRYSMGRKVTQIYEYCLVCFFCIPQNSIYDMYTVQRSPFDGPIHVLFHAWDASENGMVLVLVFFPSDSCIRMYT